MIGRVLLLLTIASSGWAAESEPVVPPADPAVHAREILARPLYQRWKRRLGEESQVSSWRADFKRWVEDMRERLFRWLMRRESPKPSLHAPGLGGSGLISAFKVAGWAAMAVAAVAILAVVIVVLRRRGALRPGVRIVSRETVRKALEEGDALVMAGADWIVEADRLVREGDFRAVYRALYLALLSGLHAQGRIDYRRNRTNWTYVAQFRGELPDRDNFAGLTDLFDRIWYGCKDAPDESVGELRRRVARLIRPTDSAGIENTAGMVPAS